MARKGTRKSNRRGKRRSNTRGNRRSSSRRSNRRKARRGRGTASLGTLAKLPKAKRMWEDVYQSALDRGYSESRSAQQAWGAVKNAGYWEDDKGVWHAPRSHNRGCGPGEIEVHRRGYERGDGTRVSPTTYCATDQGRPGETAYGAERGPHSRGKGYEPWIQEEGSLGKGFLTSMSFEKQKKALRKTLTAEKKQHHGDYVAAYRSTLGKVMALNRSTELRRRYGDKITRAREWFVKEYGEGSKRWPKDRRSNPSEISRLKNNLTALPPHLR